MKQKFVLNSDLIAELQKHPANLPIVLRRTDIDGNRVSEQLTYWEGQNPMEYQPIEVEVIEVANNMGQQGSCLRILVD